MPPSSLASTSSLPLSVRVRSSMSSKLARLRSPEFVDQRDGDLALHGKENFLFRARELRGERPLVAGRSEHHHDDR